MPKSPTPAQIEASRRNGALSKGRPRKTNLLHDIPAGMSAVVTLLPSEPKDTFQVVLDALTARHQPQDDAEALCIETMANATWRLRRCWSHTCILVHREEAKTPWDEVDTYESLLKAGTLQHYWREEARLHRTFRQAFDHLIALRQEKCPPPPGDPAAENFSAPEPENPATETKETVTPATETRQNPGLEPHPKPARSPGKPGANFCGKTRRKYRNCLKRNIFRLSENPRKTRREPRRKPQRSLPPQPSPAPRSLRPHPRILRRRRPDLFPPRAA